ncbi:MAG: acetate--CoA ligase family protein, partial [Anaerolineales bacterium]|nr:acetate--CoA ligase family protein [Anaerolineales bacterium]
PKPIIVQKANTTTASAQVAFSHTAALASDDRVLSAALAQAGIPRAQSFASAATLAQGFCLPPVRGNRLVIASRSGGHAVVAADLAAAAGFDLAPIPADFLAHVQSLNRADVITLTNPLDLGAITDFRISGQVMQEALRRLDMDALLLIQTFGMGTETALTLELGRRVQQTAGELGKPVAFCAFSHREQVDRLRAELDIPVFAEVEGAIEALAASRDHYARQARAQLLALPAPSEARPHEVEALLCRDGALGADLALGLLAAYGVPTAEWAVVDSVEGALVAAGAIGYPVALKVLSPDIVHKSDVGAISLDIEDRETLRGAFTDLLARVRGQAPDLDLRGVLVQRMAHGGREVILGGRRDPAFGPVVMFGLGGIYAEVFRDVTFRLAPLSRADAEEMVAEVRSVGLLRGARGQAASDIDAVVEALLALSELMLACPEVSEIDVNPLVVFERGAVAVDSRAVIAVPVT